MSHHPPPVPRGQPPIPQPRRQLEVGYPPGPPNVRSQPSYPSYQLPHTHPAPPLPPSYTGLQHQPWYPYQQPPGHPPPHAYQPYVPLIVSSYPRPHPPPPPSASGPIQSIPTPPSNASRAIRQPSIPSTPPPLPVAANFGAGQDNVPKTQTVTSLESPIGGSSAKSSTTASSTPPPRAVPDRAKDKQLLRKAPFQPPVPWLSVPDAPFPGRASRCRRKPRAPQSSTAPVEFPTKAEHIDAEAPGVHSTGATPGTPKASLAEAHVADTAASATAAGPTTQTLQHANATRSTSATVVPVVPIVPTSPNATKHHQPAPSRLSPVTAKTDCPLPRTDESSQPVVAFNMPVTAESVASQDEPQKPSAPQQRAPPRSWADLVRGNTQAASENGALSPIRSSNMPTSNTDLLVDVLNALAADVEQRPTKIAFVEPRGLVNTGNMCYMNSVLQTLIFCIPFYDFLDHVSARAVHSMKSELPLIDSLIMFMKEFRVIDAAASAEQLRMRLKPNELEQYGESFTPEYVYQVIRLLPRFRNMRRGHQQDAQEFLGFLFEELQEECVRATRQAQSATPSVSTPSGSDALSVVDEPLGDGWLEVGHKQRPAITRSSGHITTDSPITRIFGGKIRSEFKVPGNKNSVTLEPYQSLQLDIGSAQVNNIVDALKGLSKPETMHGDFSASRGTKVKATKQVFIESLPPVLILHLKRFQYDNASKGTQKIWKKVGYPLELEIPKEAFAPHRRNLMSAQGGGRLPKYRLIGVIYHHGKNASGGHYTVDVRRQDGREWIRMDDTLIRRVRSEDVARAGAEEDPKVLAAALERHNAGEKTNSGNMFETFEQENQDTEGTEQGWSRVNGASSNNHTIKKSMAAIVANGNASPASEPSLGSGTPDRAGVRDNKVAYLLFYQKIH